MKSFVKKKSIAIFGYTQSLLSIEIKTKVVQHVDGTKGLVELLLSLAASIKHLDRSNSNTENTNEEFRKDLEN